jgi:F-box protein 21
MPTMAKRIGNTLLELPDEILAAILLDLDSWSLTRAQQVSKRLYILCSDPIIWKARCLLDFRYWSEHHPVFRYKRFLSQRNTQSRKSQDQHHGHLPKSYPQSIDWRQVFYDRVKLETKATQLLQSIVESQTGRIAKFEQIYDLGYETKDILLKLSRSPVDADDGLAKRFISMFLI